MTHERILRSLQADFHQPRVDSSVLQHDGVASQRVDLHRFHHDVHSNDTFELSEAAAHDAEARRHFYFTPCKNLKEQNASLVM